MPKTKARMPGATIRGERRFRPEEGLDDVWTAVSATLPSPLNLHEKEEIEKAADVYLLLAQAARNAPPVAATLAALHEIRDSSQELTRLLGFFDPNDTERSEARSALSSMFLDKSWTSGSEPTTPSIAHDLWWRLLKFNEMCTVIGADLKVKAIEGAARPPRLAFTAFISALREIYIQRGLPATATKSSDLKKADSPFVEFARSIYAAMPAYNTRPRPYGDTSFSEAVATAIGKSGAGRKRQGNS